MKFEELIAQLKEHFSDEIKKEAEFEFCKNIPPDNPFLTNWVQVSLAGKDKERHQLLTEKFNEVLKKHRKN